MFGEHFVPRKSRDPLKQMSKKKTTLCKDVIKVVCRSPKYDEEEVVNAINGLCSCGYARLGKSSWEKYRKFGNRKIVLLTHVTPIQIRIRTRVMKTNK